MEAEEVMMSHFTFATSGLKNIRKKDLAGFDASKKMCILFFVVVSFIESVFHLSVRLKCCLINRQM